VKTQQTGKGLSRCCGDFLIVESSSGAVIARTSESCISGQ
jgi:hypothetical protein